MRPVLAANNKFSVVVIFSKETNSNNPSVPWEPCPWNERTCSLAALNGQLHIIIWARNQNPPCPWNEETCSWAAMNNNLEILKWLRSSTQLDQNLIHSFLGLPSLIL